MKSLVTFFLCVCCGALVSAQTDTLVILTEEAVVFVECPGDKAWIHSSKDTPSYRYTKSRHTDTMYTTYNGARVWHEFENRSHGNVEFRWWRLLLQTEQGVREITNFDTKPVSSGYILRPLAWSRDGAHLYFFSENGDASHNEQGIYSYSLTDQTFRMICQPETYSGIPLVSADREYLYFVRFALEEAVVVAHHLMSGKERIVWQGPQVGSFGVVSKTGRNTPVCAFDPDQPELRSPFLPEQEYCVTRIGLYAAWMCPEGCPGQPDLCSPLPYCEGHCSDLSCSECVDAVDMDIINDPDPESRPVVASQSGHVIRVQTVCPLQGLGMGYGFGYHVVIRHGNLYDESAPETLYAHLGSVNVFEGLFVEVGHVIGMFGNSQAVDCNGDGILDCDCDEGQNSHLHFEYHNGTGDLYDDSDIHSPIFSDVPDGPCGIQPNNSYVAGEYGMENWLMPNANIVDYILSIDCDGISYIALIGETCWGCQSSWLLYGVEIPDQDTLVIPMIPQFYNENGVLWVNREVISPLIAISMYSEDMVPMLDFLESECNPGCTNPSACNFDPESLMDDGSCEYDCWDSCVYADINDDLVVNIFDVFLFFGMMGQNVEPFANGDMDGNGTISSSDFLMLLFYFGQMCGD